MCRDADDWGRHDLRRRQLQHRSDMELHVAMLEWELCQLVELPSAARLARRFGPDG